MSDRKTLKELYEEGMSKYDQLNPPSIWSRLYDVYSEFCEVLEAIFIDRSWTEFIKECTDVLHTLCRLTTVLGASESTATHLAFTFAPETASKHAKRYQEHNCIRNKPHCDAGNHNCPAQKDM